MGRVGRRTSHLLRFRLSRSGPDPQTSRGGGMFWKKGACPLLAALNRWGPGGHAGIDPRERLPIGPRRAEDVDRHAAVGTGAGLVGHVGRDAIGVARPQLARLAADREAQLALEDESQLLVGMRVLGHVDVGLEVDEAELHVATGDGMGMRALPDPVRPKLGEAAAEGAHGAAYSIRRSMIVAVPIPPPQHIVSSP